ncbi:MAG: hypothetical protein ACRDD8_05225 [Bacteroidales bacterium]
MIKNVEVIKVLNAHSVLMKLIDTEMSYGKARKFKKLVDITEAETRAFEDEKKKAHDKVSHIEDEAIRNKEFQVAMDSILRSEIEIDVMELTANDLCDFSLTVRDLVFIDFLIAE